MRKLLVLWAAVFIAAHIPALPASLADFESINFGLAIREFDVSANQPHPPGSPHFVGLARLATALLFGLGDPLNVPHALALINLIGAALALVSIFWLARAIGYSTRAATGASLVAGTIPLYWFSAARPLDDFPGLAIALAAQALLVPSLIGPAAGAVVARRRWDVAAGAALAGIAAGFRMQTALLTFPLLIAVLASRRTTGAVRLQAVGAAAAGLLTWLVPVLMDAGARGYAGAVMAKAGLDFREVEMLARHPSLRLLGEALHETFVDPFGSPVLAAVMLGACVLGIALAAVRRRSVLKVLAIGYLPYIAVHLLFQDTVINRHAIPLLPAIALLFVLPFEYISLRAVLPAAAGAATAGLLIAVPALQAHGSAESPGFALIRDLHRVPRVQETVLAMHTRIATDLERHRSWQAIPPMRTLPATSGYEWLELVNLWKEGYEGPIWFLADPRRTDLRQIDPQQRRLMRQYSWPESDRPFVGGIRPDRIDWYFIQRPGWFLGRGWALSPEMGGLNARDREGAPAAVAWVRRRDTASTLMLGGRHLGAKSDPLVQVRVRVDGRQVDEWSIRPGPFVFMRPLLFEELDGTSPYAQLEIDATWAGSGPAPISLEQFDFQGIDGTVVAYDEGWWEPEYHQRSGQSWRWTSREAKLWLFNPGRDLTLVISGEDPTRYYRGGTEMTVLVGEREVGRYTLDAHFSLAVAIPVEPLSVARGRVTLRFADAHVPGRLRASPDMRELGVRIFEVKVH